MRIALCILFNLLCFSLLTASVNLRKEIAASSDSIPLQVQSQTSGAKIMSPLGRSASTGSSSLSTPLKESETVSSTTSSESSSYLTVTTSNKIDLVNSQGAEGRQQKATLDDLPEPKLEVSNSKIISENDQSKSPAHIVRRPSALRRLLQKSSKKDNRAAELATNSPQSSPSLRPRKFETAAVDSTATVSSLYQEGLVAFKEGNYQRAYTCFMTVYTKKESDIHRPLAARWLGEKALRGWSVPVDFALAHMYLIQASKQDTDSAVRAEAYELLGEMYYYGHGVPQSYTTAIDYFQKVVGPDETLVAHGIHSRPKSAIPSLFFLLRLNRMGGKNNLNKNDTSEHLFKEAAQLSTYVIEFAEENRIPNDEEIIIWLYVGRLALDEGRLHNTYDKAEKCFEKVAKSENVYYAAEACYRLGKLYCGPLNSPARAKEFLDLAAQQDVNKWVKPLAFIHLGHMYKNGTLSTQGSTVKQALEQYEKALEQSHNMAAQAEAVYHCARLHEQGAPDVPINMVKVLAFDEQVANQEHSLKYRFKAQFALGMHYYQGLHLVPINLMKAEHYLTRVVEECYDPSLLEETWFRLAEMLFEGKGGVKKDVDLALTYYDRMYVLGKKMAYKHLAACRLGEAALENKDFERAERFLKEAAEFSYNPKAQRDARAALPVLEQDKQKKDDNEKNSQ